MANKLNDVKFIRNKSGLGSPLPTKDHVSGIIFYNDTLPTGFSTSKRIIKVFSLEEAEDLGITETSAEHKVEWYHLDEFFQKNPKGEIYIAYYAVPSTPSAHTFDEILNVQRFAEGEIRQMGIYYKEAPFDPAFLTACQTNIKTLQDEHKPLNVLFGGDIKDVDLSTLGDLTQLQAENVSACIGQDGDNRGAQLFADTLKSITDLGAKLGHVSFAKVSDCIAWVEKFPLVTDGFEFQVPAFANGDLFKNVAPNLIENLDSKGYIFLRKIVGIGGTYHNDSYTAVSTDNDFSTIENGRTIDKAIRLSRTKVLPKLASPLFVNPNGTLTEDTIATFKSLVDQALAQMEADGEISQYETIINPAQNVVSTSKLEISIKIVPVGVAREIVINIGFVPNL